MVVLSLHWTDIDFGSAPGYFTGTAAGVRFVAGLASDRGEGLHLLSSTPDTDTGPPLVSVAVPTTTPMAAGTAVSPIGAAPPSKDPLLDSATGKASSTSGLSGSSISAASAKSSSSPSIPMLVQIPARQIGARATLPSSVDPFDGDEPVKASPPLSSVIAKASAPLAPSPISGSSTLPGVQPVQPVQRAPAPARPLTVAVPSAPVAPVVPAVPVAPVAPVAPLVPVVPVVVPPSLNFGPFASLGRGGAALDPASNADKARLKPTTTFLSGATEHMLGRDANGTSLFRNANTTPPSPSGNVEWYPLTEVIYTYDDPGPEMKATLVFRRPGASESDAAILAKLGQAGYKHVLDALGNEFGARAMWSVVGRNTEWFCKTGPSTRVLVAPTDSALVATQARAYKKPNDPCRVFAPDPVGVPAVTAVAAVATPRQVQPAAPPAAPPTQIPAAQPAAQPSPFSPAFLATLLQSAQPVQPAQPAQVQPAQPGGSVQTVALPAAPPTQIPADTLAATAGSTVAQPAQVQQPVSQQQPATQRQPDTQLTVTATPQASSLGCTEFEVCLARASAGDILACGNKLRASGCAGAAAAAGAAGAASVYQYSSGTGPLVPLRKLTSGALYGSDAERAYTVVPDTASPSRGKVLVSSLSGHSSPSSASSADSLDSVYPCALSGNVWAVVPVLPVLPVSPAEPQDAQVQYTRTDTTPATTKAPDLTVLWIVLGALGFALCLGALYAATRPRGLAASLASRGPGAVVL